MQENLTFIQRQHKTEHAASIQKMLNWFVFFLAFPAINLLGSSITFYIFIAILLKVGSFWKKRFKGRMVFFSFLALIIFSTFLAPYDKLTRQPGFVATFQILIQYIYWIFLAAFFIVHIKKINFFLLSKWLYYGTICALLGFYFFKINLDLSFAQISLDSTRNSLVFTLLCTIPISFYYLSKKKNKINMAFYFAFFLLAMLFTNGRSGAVIIIIQLILVATILYPLYNRIFKFAIVPFLLLFFVLQTDGAQIYLNGLANQVESVNPRFASLLRQEGEGDLSSDKSWLTRKLMIDKGMEIVGDYPISGIGPNNFRYYDADIGEINSYERLQGQTKEYYNGRSAHNSYVQTMAEMGFLGLFFMIWIIIVPLFYFFKNFWYNRLTLYHLPLLSLLGISIHFYAIASLTGAIPWLIFGLAWASTTLKQQKAQ